MKNNITHYIISYVKLKIIKKNKKIHELVDDDHYKLRSAIVENDISEIIKILNYPIYDTIEKIQNCNLLYNTFKFFSSEEVKNLITQKYGSCISPNIEKRTILIHKHGYKCGGIGDFIGSSLSFFTFCKKYNIEYRVDFGENTNMNYCFSYNQGITCKHDEIEQIFLIVDRHDDPRIMAFLDKLKYFPKTYIVKSNAIGFSDKNDVKKCRKEFFTNFLKPTELVCDTIQSIYEKYKLNKYNYISVHIRCGDANMEKINTITNDKRIDTNNNVIDNYVHMIEKFYEKYCNDMVLVIHSDSCTFKTQICKKLKIPNIYIDINIKHIAENIGENSIDGYVQTISEFYIIAQAKKIYIPNIYSGFSYIASLVNNTKLYTNINGNESLKFKMFDDSHITFL